jgi:hypothetical protein
MLPDLSIDLDGTEEEVIAAIRDHLHDAISVH